MSYFLVIGVKKSVPFTQIVNNRWAVKPCHNRSVLQLFGESFTPFYLLIDGTSEKFICTESMGISRRSRAYHEIRENFEKVLEIIVSVVDESFSLKMIVFNAKRDSDDEIVIPESELQFAVSAGMPSAVKINCRYHFTR